jgi:DNA relaxase NicK
MNPSNNPDDYFHFEIPGQACDLMNPEYFQALEDLLSSNYENKYQYKRLDFAFDNVPFSPEEVKRSIKEGKVRSLAKRESLHIKSSPFEKRNNGELGTYTVEFGSPNSQRMITVYNKRGPTRLEFQMKDERAHRIACELFQAYDIQSWYQIMIGHLRDYIDIFTPWWDEFTKSIGRAHITVSNPKDVTLEKILEWFDNQISPAFSAIVDTQSPDVINGMINRGRYRRSARYNLLVGHDDNG